MWQNAVVLKNKDVVALLETTLFGRWMQITVKGTHPKNFLDIFHIL